MRATGALQDKLDLDECGHPLTLPTVCEKADLRKTYKAAL